MIEVEDLVFEYPGHRALDGVSVHIAAGTATALVGPNGAGKSTLLRCMAGLERPLSGHLAVNGISVLEQPREVHRHLGYLSDFFGLYEGLSVQQGLHYAALARGLTGPQAASRVQDVAQQMDLTDLLARKPGALSRGQRQRLAIGQAIVHQPQVLLLDEPASGLDPEARDRLATLLRQLQAQGMTLVVSSHILSELDAYSTHVLSLHSGRVQQHAPLRAEVEGEAAQVLYVLELAHPGQLPEQRELPLPRDPQARAAQVAQLLAQGLPVAGLWPARDSVQALYLRGRQASPAMPCVPEAPCER